MKKFSKFLFAAIFASVALTSCEDDVNPDKPEPTLAVTELNQGIVGGKITVVPGTMLSFRWNAVKAGGGKNLEMFSVGQQGVNVLNPLPNTATGKTLPIANLPNTLETQYVDTLNISAGMNMGVTEYTFTVTDEEGLSAKQTVTVTVAAAATPLNVVKTGSIYHVEGSKPGAYNLVTDVAVIKSGANADKDMNNISMAGSPFTGSFKSENGTLFVKASASFDYANATEEAAMVTFANGTGVNTVVGATTGDVYVAKLRGGNDYTVIKVTALDANNNDCGCGNKGKMTFEYKRK